MPENHSSPTGPVAPAAQNSTLRMEYEQVNQNFRTLTDIRFKLLALIPALAGAAIYVLSHMALSTPSPDSSDFGTVVLISALGFSATFGITLYDQRNTAFYNALVSRARKLEGQLEIPEGQFISRPARRPRLVGVVIGHDFGLALIYGPVLGAWFYPMVYAALKWMGIARPLCLPALQFALLFALAVTLLFIEEFFRLDLGWKKLRERRSKKKPESKS